MKEREKYTRLYKDGVFRTKEIWGEILGFAGAIIVQNLVYSMSNIVVQGISSAYMKEVMVDCLFIFLACLPGWWLHFYRFRQVKLQERFLLHLLSAIVFYGIWVLAYQVYNPLTGRPAISGTQVLLNMGPNILFYIQAFSFLHLYHFFRQREAQIQQEKELRELAYNGEIAALKAQIQPHFLFNTLNSISASVPQQQESTRELIARLADTFRYALTATQEDRVPLAQELDFIRTYLSLEQQRFGKRLEVYIHTGEQVAGLPIPPMLLQPLVENALKHGIEPCITGGKITISCTRKGKKVKISVANTGTAYEGPLQDIFRSNGVGLRNTAGRLSKLYNEPLDVHREAGELSFTFFIPVSGENR